MIALNQGMSAALPWCHVGRFGLARPPDLSPIVYVFRSAFAAFIFGMRTASVIIPTGPSIKIVARNTSKTTPPPMGPRYLKRCTNSAKPLSN